MGFEIEFVAEAVADLDRVKPFHRNQVLDAIEAHLRLSPQQTSRSRIKRLHSMGSPAYRLRVGEYRVFYDVDEAEHIVTVLRVLSKEQSLLYLMEAGHEQGPAGENE